MRQPRPDFLQQLNVKFPYKDSDGTIQVQPMPITYAWALFYTYKKAGLDALFRVAKLGAIAIRGDDNLTKLEAERLDMLIGVPLSHFKKFDSEEQLLLFMTYQVLREKQITREQAAQIVTWLTGKEMKADTWRKKMDKYIEAEGLDSVELPKGRPKGAKPESNTAVSD